ncbi:MAG: ribonuclease R [Clostridia bacterium]|nr:ribonuclease R [Clostridia bacterium]
MDRKEKIIGFINSEKYIPMKEEELAVLLSVPKQDRPQFSGIIRELLNEGLIYKAKHGNIHSGEKSGLIKGQFTCTSKGFGFVLRDGEEDIFIPKNACRGAMHYDTVLAKITIKAQEDRRCEGEIVRILSRNTTHVVGTLKRVHRRFLVIPDNEKLWHYIDIPKGNVKGGQKGQKVYVKITKYPSDKSSPEGKVEEILGWPQDNDIAIKSVIYSYGLSQEFNDSVKKELEYIPVSVTEDMIKDRQDKRGDIVITIDGEDAKDLDDAVSVKILDNGNYLLSVHIADVSEYVRQGTSLDDEAFKRGTSVYLPGTVIPMLPPKLSNGICSLNEGVSRLTLSVDMEFDSKGNLINHDIYKSVICSSKRMTYTDVKKIIDKDKQTINKYNDLSSLIWNMHTLAQILNRKRKSEGYIDFNFPEAKVIFDDDMNVAGVALAEINEANNLIEEFMLAANSCVAEHFFWLNAPFVYRVHETPDNEKITNLKKLLSAFNIILKGRTEDIKPKALSDMLEKVKDEPYGEIIQEAALRAMKKAKYHTYCGGHFGLSVKYYCHFTSPIRRYPDLLIHRIIKRYLDKGTLPENDIAFLTDYTEKSAVQSSNKEINAQEAERTAVKIKIAQYMEGYLGHIFEGKVCSVTGFGLFVRLPNMVEGLISMNNLNDDYYEFHSERMYLKGTHTGKEYHIGDNIRVVLSSVNTITGEIDFTLE